MRAAVPGPRWHTAVLDDADALNARLFDAVQRERDGPAARKTHFYGGRYENLYIDAERLPGVQRILDAGRAHAAGILGVPADSLSMDFWLNAMGPGQRTLPHRHDAADEKLSGVYYIRVPWQSGELILGDDYSETRIEPEEGLFVFFPPSVEHAVSLNESDAERLSLAMNFG